MKDLKKKYKEFLPTSWAIGNKASIYVVMVIITIMGLVNYIQIPKEQFPEIVIPTILVSTPYPGTSPTDIENLVSRPIEKQIKSLAGVKKVTSTSIQDFSSVVVEFNTDVDVKDAKQRVKDAVDKSKSELPNNLPAEPNVMEIDFSEIPILYIQLSGDYPLDKLKHYAELAQDKFEGLPEITRVDIVGALDREIQINVDLFKMQASSVTFSDIERAISLENMTISGGNITNYGVNRSIRVEGQIKDPQIISNIALKSGSGALVYIRDIAQVVDTFKTRENYSYLGGKNVITLNIVKKSGKNLIEATDKIKEIIKNDLSNKVFPSDVKVTLSGEMARNTRNTLEELNNTILIGFLLVTVVLMFFMGFSNAFFVGLSAPLSIFVAYMIIPSLGFTMNMMVMFAFIFALGIIVDDAIVVIENTHRIHKTVPDIVEATKRAAGEVFMPIFSGTLTTLAPFFPLAFWPGIVGNFMYYMPVTLIVTLFASLFVAYIINPVFAVQFMKHEADNENFTKSNPKKVFIISMVLLILAAIGYATKYIGFGNLMVFFILVLAFYHFALRKIIFNFQSKWWPNVLNLYARTLDYITKGRRPYNLLYFVIGLFIFTIILVGIKKPQILFFPDNSPNSVDVIIRTPVGTDVMTTDSIARLIEKKVMLVLGPDNKNVESVITNVATGADDGLSFDRSSASHKAKITVNFVEFKNRVNINTMDVLGDIRDAVTGMPGVEISVQKNRMGPPTGKPVNIEISSENLDDLVSDAKAFKNYINDLQIPGIEELKSDFQDNKAEIIVDIDRRRANMEGITSAQIGSEIRTAVFGKEVSKFKEGEDEFPITVRYVKVQRENIDLILNHKITYRDMNSGLLRQIPLSSVAKVEYKNTYGGIKRKDMKRVITLSSTLLSGYSANDVSPKIKMAAERFQWKNGVSVDLGGGEQADQKETGSFLGKAMMIALGLIFFILITQFNSFSSSLIILSGVFFSVIGVLLGIVIFNMSISIIMTGLGIVALGGIVVRNGILIVEFIEVLRKRGLKTRAAVIEAGKTRITPVVLTASATMLGLVPLAIGMNIDFVTMFTELNPHLHFGGDNVAFWGPLSWTIIFGLSFSTFLTLVFVPAMYLIAYRMKIRVKRNKSNRIARKMLR